MGNWQKFSFAAGLVVVVAAASLFAGTGRWLWSNGFVGESTIDDAARGLSVSAPDVGFASSAFETTGFRGLFIGHSFFRPFADRLPLLVAEAGIEGHSQDVVFSGGASGSPQALWENAGKRAQIQAVLDTGEVELFGMTYEPTYPTTEGYENWIDYALSKNSETEFVIGLPWPDFPANYDAATFYDFWMSAHDTLWHDFIDSLRALYPGVRIDCLPYGRSALELRKLFAEGNLPDVSLLTGNTNQAIFTDSKGHAAEILRELGTLVWLRALYDVDVTLLDYDPGYVTDLKAIAQMIMDEHDAAQLEPAEVTPVRSTRFAMRDDATVPINSKKRRFTFRSSPFKGNPSEVFAPAFGGASDPTLAGETGGGATLTIYKVSGDPDDAVLLELPATRWEQSGSSSRPGYRYKDSRLEDGPISKVQIRNGLLTIIGKGDGLYTLEDAPQVEMAMRLQLGTGTVFCASAEPKEPTSKNDSTSRFNGDKSSPAPEICPPVSDAYGSASRAFLAPGAGLLD